MTYYIGGTPGAQVTLSTGDLQIGAVELKDEDSDDRAVCKIASTLADTDIVLGVADPNLDAKIPALGAAAAAACMPVALSTEDAAKVPALGSAADAACVPVTMSTEDKAKVAALGVAASAASSPVVMASDDAHLGAVGAAADVDGHVHGQLRYIGESVDSIPEVGSAAMAAALPVTIATDDTVLFSLESKAVELDLSGAPVQVSLSTSTARSSQLAVGRYVIKSDARTFVRQGSVTSDATVTTDWAIEANVEYVMNVTNTTTLGYISGILAAGTGTLSIQATL